MPGPAKDFCLRKTAYVELYPGPGVASTLKEKPERGVRVLGGGIFICHPFEEFGVFGEDFSWRECSCAQKSEEP